MARKRKDVSEGTEDLFTPFLPDPPRPWRCEYGCKGYRSQSDGKRRHEFYCGWWNHNNARDIWGDELTEETPRMMLDNLKHSREVPE